MKKVLFWLFVILSVAALADVGRMFIFDRLRLTEYGWGFLLGKFILFIIFAVAAYIFYKKSRRPAE